MEQIQRDTPREIVAIKVHQWLREWEEVAFNDKAYRRRPDPYFYMFTLSASELKALSGIRRRTIEGGLLRSQDLGNQRRHDPGRSEEIYKFVHHGYPWSDLSEAKRESGQFGDLRNPGWLPTAIVLNILKSGDTRNDRKVAEEDLVGVQDTDGRTAIVKLPEQFSGSSWQPTQLHPLEIIDGQHRLWAFEQNGVDVETDFELPVVAFHGLDVSWQAYLFWTINIKPKRINASLAFDMYPLLRTEDWLERFEGHSIYRETRAQELTEILWSHSKSPWYHRINMLGDPGQRMVTQAAWIRSLMATYVKSFEGPGISVGGLFGAPVGSDRGALPWGRAQQAAFLIFCWRKVQDAIQKVDAPWAERLRSHRQQQSPGTEQDPAFAGPHTLLNTDQGVRGVLYMTNDLCYARADDLNLGNWLLQEDANVVNEEAVSRALGSLSDQLVNSFLDEIASALAQYDWSSSSVPDFTEQERASKLVFRGSGGYRELRRQLLRHLAPNPGAVGDAATSVLTALGYE